MGKHRRKHHSQIGSLLGLVLIATAVSAAIFVYQRWLHREQRYNQLITEMSEKYGVDKFLIKAVIRRESQFDPYTAGKAGEIGLMQIMPGTGEQWARANGVTNFGRESLWNEKINIEAGTWYLARALHHWEDRDDPVPFALAEYNAGPGNCQRWLPNGQATTADEFRQAITYPSVRHYIDTVLEFRDDYRANGEL
jgi:soluble lytic murein transglycosylase